MKILIKSQNIAGCSAGGRARGGCATHGPVRPLLWAGILIHYAEAVVELVGAIAE